MKASGTFGTMYMEKEIRRFEEFAVNKEKILVVDIYLTKGGYQAAEAAPYTYGDANRLEQVFLNLLDRLDPCIQRVRERDTSVALTNVRLNSE